MFGFAIMPKKMTEFINGALSGGSTEITDTQLAEWCRSIARLGKIPYFNVNVAGSVNVSQTGSIEIDSGGGVNMISGQLKLSVIDNTITLTTA